MASGSFALTRTGSTSSYITFNCSWSSTSNGTTANSSTVKVTVTATKSSSSTASTYGTQETTATVDGSSQSNSGSFTLAPGKTVTLLSKSYTVKHNADGTKSCTIKVNVGGNIIYANGSKTVTLDTIPQYATVTQTLSSKTETTAVMKYTASAVVDYIWYSTNNGSSWTGINVADASSGTYTISGLAANTTYQIKTRVRRKDSQRTTDSSALSVTTYNYPYAESMPSFTIGSKLTLGLYNPLKRNVTVNILGADNSQISNDTTTGTSISGYNGTTVVNNLYKSIPNAQKGTYKVKVTYGSQSNTKTGGTYSVNTNVCKPAVSSASYEDTNSTTTAITENDQLIIQNQGKVMFTAGLQAKNSATLKTCKVAVNGANYNMTINGNSASVSNVVINSASDITAVVTVTDSRGLAASRNVTVKMLAWSLPSAGISIERHNNYYDETDFTVDADYSSLDGKNTIAIKVRYKEAGTTTWGSWVDLQDNVTSTISLNNRKEWDIQIQLKDIFGTTTYNASLAKGIPIEYWDRLKNSVGINGFPEDEESFEVNGFNLTPSVITASLSQTITNLTVNNYTAIGFDTSVAAGSKFTLQDDGGILVGRGVTKVLVSARMLIGTDNTAGNRHIRIVKNSYSNDNTLAWTFEPIEASSQDTITIAPTVAEVEEGDVLYLMYYTGNSADDINGGFGARTSLTVQAVG